MFSLGLVYQNTVWIFTKLVKVVCVCVWFNCKPTVQLHIYNYRQNVVNLHYKTSLKRNSTWACS